MPRRNRVHVPGGVYHVVARGVRRERIFYEMEDYRAYLELLRRTCGRYGVGVVAYVLMPNHVHLVVRAGEVPVGRAMQYLHGQFGRWYNRRYGYVGHVFEGRYGARLCEDERYLWALVRYVHGNPVRAGLVDRPEGYAWSSFGEYTSGRWEVVSEAEVRGLFGRPEPSALAGL